MADPKPKRKRPKVRYVPLPGPDRDSCGVVAVGYGVSIFSKTVDSCSWNSAKRIAAALNLAEAVRKGEV